MARQKAQIFADERNKLPPEPARFTRQVLHRSREKKQNTTFQPVAEFLMLVILRNLVAQGWSAAIAERGPPRPLRNTETRRSSNSFDDHSLYYGRDQQESCSDKRRLDYESMRSFWVHVFSHSSFFKPPTQHELRDAFVASVASSSEQHDRPCRAAVGCGNGEPVNADCECTVWARPEQALPPR
ncbi:MAG: hypothetical protein ACPIOQ_00145 [Promethearchaeia archaeon]